jgi:hypothetical protein
MVILFNNGGKLGSSSATHNNSIHNGYFNASLESNRKLNKIKHTVVITNTMQFQKLQKYPNMIKL